MRLKSLTLRHFRCHGELELDLSSDITVLYGRNGTGKTSIFDALELAFTGAVSRLGVDLTSQVKAALSDVCTSSDPMIRAAFGESEEHWLQLTWDRRGKGGLEISSDLSGSRDLNSLAFRHFLYKDFAPARRELRHIRSLFNSTVFLSQEQMRAFISSEGQRREHVLSTLAGSPDVQRRVDKAREVLRLLVNQIAKSEEVLEEAGARSEQIHQRISELLVPGSPPLAALVRLQESAAAADVPLPDDLTKHPHTFAERMRTVLEERTRRVQAVLERIETLERMASRKKNVEARLAASLDTFRELSGGLPELRSDLEIQETTSHRLLADLERVKEEIDLAESLRARDMQLLERLRALRREEALCDAVQRRLDALNRRRDRIANDLHNTCESLLQVGRARSDNVQAISELQSEAEALRRHSSILEQTSEITKQLHELEKECEQLALQTQHLQNTRRDLLSEHSGGTARRDSLQKRIDGLREESDARTKLLSQFLTDSEAAACPLCGHAHASADKLVEAIQSAGGRKQSELVKLETECSDAATRINEVENGLAEVAAELEWTDAREKSLYSERERIGEALDALNEELPEHVPTYSSEDIAAHTMEKIQQVEELLKRRNRIEEGVEQLERFRKLNQEHLNRVASSITYEQERHGRAEARAESAKDDLRKSERDSDQAYLDERTLEVMLESRARTLSVSSANKERLETQLVDSSRATQSLMKHISDLESVLRSARNSEEEAREFLRDYEVLMRSVGLDEPVSQKAIAELREQTVQHRDAVVPVLQDADSYVSIVEFEALTQQREAADAGLDKAKEEAARLRSAEQKLQMWTRELEFAAQEAVSSRIERLRDEINALFRAIVAFPEKFDSVTVSDKALQLGIIYSNAGSHEAEPEFYLSSAELNALALSLFLSFACSQQCFRFRFILLDDPIQHLDDLDAVAFLDTVRSIVSAQGLGRRQVLLSTCDRELYRLAIRKFSILNNRNEGSFTAISLGESGLAPASYDVGGPNQASIMRGFQ